jgi:hypothetical protein
VQAERVDQIRVDPAALQSAASEVTRLAAMVRASRLGAEGQLGAATPRLGELGRPLGDQWRAAAAALDRVETDFREIGRALSELSAYFAELDRHAVNR